MGVLSVRLMGLSMGIGDHSIGSDLLPRPLMTSSSGEGVRERYEDGKLTVADQVRLLSMLPAKVKIKLTLIFIKVLQLSHNWQPCFMHNMESCDYYGMLCI